MNLEVKLLNQFDLVIATSENLLKTRKNNRSETLLLTHGFEIGIFKETNSSYSKSTIKTIGYYGLIDDRCDIDLLTDLAMTMPNLIFKIIGEWRVPNENISELHNVEQIGAVPYSELPKYTRDIDIFILPYRINELTKSINPLKLKEYLATGKPIISTPLPEVIKLSRFINIASNVEEFRKVINYLITNEIDNDNKDLIDYLDGESWEKKTETFSDYVMGALRL